MKTVEDMRSEIAIKAEADASFRSELVADPKAVIERELDITVPEGFKIQVHEDSADTAHLVLPSGDKLANEDLLRVVGGSNGQDAVCK